jgi:hypothetical protein
MDFIVGARAFPVGHEQFCGHSADCEYTEFGKLFCDPITAEMHIRVFYDTFLYSTVRSVRRKLAKVSQNVDETNATIF